VTGGAGKRRGSPEGDGVVGEEIGEGEDGAVLLEEELAGGGEVAGDVGGAEAGADFLDGSLNLLDDAGGAVAGSVAWGFAGLGVGGDGPVLIDLAAKRRGEEDAYLGREEAGGEGDVDGCAGVGVGGYDAELGLEAGDVDGAGEGGGLGGGWEAQEGRCEQGVEA
jgi:hypothetical protein